MRISRKYPFIPQTSFPHPASTHPTHARKPLIKKYLECLFSSLAGGKYLSSQSLEGKWFMAFLRYRRSHISTSASVFKQTYQKVRSEARTNIRYQSESAKQLHQLHHNQLPGQGCSRLFAEPGNPNPSDAVRCLKILNSLPSELSTNFHPTLPQISPGSQFNDCGFEGNFSETRGW